MSEESYNGWHNRETWCVALWLSNEESSYRYWQDAAREAYREAKDDPDVTKGTFTRKESAGFALKDRLKEEHEEAAGLASGQQAATVFTDLMQGALDSVDWYEIAHDDLLEGCEGWDEDEEDDDE